MLDINKIQNTRIQHVVESEDVKYEALGAQDGDRNGPPDITALLDSLVSDAAAALTALKADLAAHANALESKIGDLQQRLKGADENRDTVKEARERKLASVTRQYDVTAVDSTQKLKLQEAEAAYQRVFNEVDGRPLRGGSHWAYLGLMTFIAIIEWPVNRLAFAAFFQESPQFASLLALFVGIALAILAHFVGLLAKRVGYQDFSRNRRIRYWSGVGFCVFFALLVIYTVTLARHSFLSLLAEAKVSALDLFRGAVPEKIAESFFSPNFGVGDYALLIVNMLVLTIAIAFSFAHHDEHPDYLRVARAREKARKSYDKAKAEYDRLYNEVTNEFLSRSKHADQAVTQLNSEIQTTRSERERIEGALEPAISNCANAIILKLDAYVRGNKKTRDGSQLVTPETSAVVARIRQRITV